MPVGDQMRRGKRDGADIIAVDQRDQHRPDQHLDLERAQPAFVNRCETGTTSLAIFPPGKLTRGRAPLATKVGDAPREAK